MCGNISFSMVMCRESASGIGPAMQQISMAVDLYGCTGWVRNEWDGSVSMEIQGEESQIDQVILAIERGTYVRIENMKVKTIPVVEHDYGFRTR